MSEILCSHCFYSKGLSLEAQRIGVINKSICPNCKNVGGAKLDYEQVLELFNSYFIEGTFHRTEFGGAHVLQSLDGIQRDSSFDEYVHFSPFIDMRDIRLICERINKRLVYNAPAMWRLGRNDWLEKLSMKGRKDKVVKTLIRCFSDYTLQKGEYFYRLRSNPTQPILDVNTFDAPKKQKKLGGRLNIETDSILYGAFDIETCIHEARANYECEMYLASLIPTQNLNLLDLTNNCSDDSVTPFESVALCVRQLFYSGKESYKITRLISKHARQAGYDGIIYPSYFSSVSKNHDSKNIALFGQPIMNGLVKVASIDRLLLKEVIYEYSLGAIMK